jgi:hypothetical protein
MGGETVNIAEIANRISDDLFKWFKWNKIPLMDENFNCHKVSKHSERGIANVHTHPVDVVFNYFDPYLNKQIYLNTDLKSYSKTSISSAKIRASLKSLAMTIDCARGSSEWSGKYVLDEHPYEVRGLLFVYNHDDKYEKTFFEHFDKIKIDNLSLGKDQLVNIIEPESIRYLNSIVADMNFLHKKGEFPSTKYSFFYPDLYLHKSHGIAAEHPATVETLTSPYMIIRHEGVDKLDEDSGKVERTFEPGYVIYYNRECSSEYEFIYLFDTLSRFQILNSGENIRIRVANKNASSSMMSNYRKAINLYVSVWDFDKFKKKQLESIEIEQVNIAIPKYSAGVIGWRV